MYTAKEKERFIEDAVWIIISKVLGFAYEIEEDDAESIFEGGIRLKKEEEIRCDIQKNALMIGKKQSRYMETFKRMMKTDLLRLKKKCWVGIHP